MARQPSYARPFQRSRYLFHKSDEFLIQHFALCCHQLSEPYKFNFLLLCEVMKKSEATEKRFLYSFNILQLYDAHDFASV